MFFRNNCIYKLNLFFDFFLNIIFFIFFILKLVFYFFFILKEDISSNYMLYLEFLYTKWVKISFIIYLFVFYYWTEFNDYFEDTDFPRCFFFSIGGICEIHFYIGIMNLDLDFQNYWVLIYFTNVQYIFYFFLFYFSFYKMFSRCKSFSEIVDLFIFKNQETEFGCALKYIFDGFILTYFIWACSFVVLSFYLDKDFILLLCCFFYYWNRIMWKY